MRKGAYVGAAAFAGVAVWLRSIVRADIPAHLIGHKPVIVPDIMSPEQGAEIFNLALEMQTYETAINDVKFQQILAHEHVGEAEKISSSIDADGQMKYYCKHPFLVPSADRSLCILANRVDVGKHFVMAGGVEGLKEEYSSMVSRVQPFMRYMYNYSAYPVISDLFTSEKFQNAAKSVCPPSKQVLDPFQFNFILQLPGQTVATHVDAPYFWGATRFQFPQWLLASMLFSDLFKSKFVEQVQVVGYFHRWSPASSSNNNKDDKSKSRDVPDEESGEFVYWDTNEAAPRGRLAPVPLSGVAIDGSKTIHAASVYRRQRVEVDSNGERHTSPYPLPVIDKSKPSTLVYEKESAGGGDTGGGVGDGPGGEWYLRSDGKTLGTYQTDDLRMSIVYRARCFESEEQRQVFLAQLHTTNSSTSISLDSIFATFIDDLAQKGVHSREKMQGMGRLELSLAIMSHYIKYPLPAISRAAVPYNYCALSRLFPVVAPFLRPLCTAL